MPIAGFTPEAWIEVEVRNRPFRTEGQALE